MLSPGCFSRDQHFGFQVSHAQLAPQVPGEALLQGVGSISQGLWGAGRLPQGTEGFLRCEASTFNPGAALSRTEQVSHPCVG